jgi:hypothetical protein
MKKLTTIGIYEEDCIELERIISPGETFREKIHELVLAAQRTAVQNK